MSSVPLELEYDIDSKRAKNLKVLKSVNSRVQVIIEDVPYVAIYEFDDKTGTWKRMGVEGSAFITENGSPGDADNSFIVLNKKGNSIEMKNNG
jgi:hypothetical protein